MLPSLVEMSVKPTPDQKPQKIQKPQYIRRRRQIASIVLSEPVPQNIALALFKLAPRREFKGFYGAVRQLHLETIHMQTERAGVSRIAIKKSDVTTEERMRVTYNEYLKHREVYNCIESAHPTATVYYAYPFQMVIPCERVRPESRDYSDDADDAMAINALTMTIQLPDREDSEDSESDEEELLTTSCDSASGYVYTIQSWGCSDDELSKSLDDLYDHLTPERLSEVGRDVGRALWYLHSCEYMHNDLSLRNILVCSTPTQTRALMLDFGLAKRELAPLSEANFWSEMAQVIGEVYKKQSGGKYWWKPWDEFKGQSVLIDAAYQAWSDNFTS